MEYFKVRKFQISPYLAAISASLAILVGVCILDRSEQERFLQHNRATTIDRLSTVRSKLEGSLNSRLFLMRGLVAYISNNPKITEAEFAATARILLAQQIGIRNITLVKGTTVAYIYPRVGNEAALGVDLTALPEQREIVEQAIETRKTVLAGPVKLLAGGVGFISRSPIFLTPSGADPETGVYWGLAGLVIDKDSLMDEAGLNDPSAKLQYALQGKDAKGVSGEVFFGDGAIFQNNPIVLEVTLPSGSWQLAAIPLGGWPTSSPFRGFLLTGGGLLALLSGVVAFSWVYGPIKLRESEAKYRQLVENANSMIVQLDSEGKITFFNEFAETFFGYSEAEIIGKSAIGTIIPKTDLSENDLAAMIRDCLAQPEKYCQNENENIRRNGERVWIAWTNKPLLDAKGNLARLLCIGTDIGDRKQAEIALQASESELRALFAAMNDVIFVIDKSGRYLKIAPTNPELLYKPPAELIGKTLHEMMPPETADFFLSQIQLTADTKQTHSLEYSLQIGNKDVWFAANIAPMQENTVIWMARDITQRKQAENWLTGQKQVLEMIAKSNPLGETLNTLVKIIEQQSRDVMGSILLLDQDGQHLLHGAAPSLPESYNAAVHEIAIGPNVGSCGTAVYRCEQVIVTDIASDPLWQNFRDFTLGFGLRACWCAPILSSQGQVLGTFAMYCAQPRSPENFELELIEAVRNLAGIAIERKQAEESLKQLNEELENRVKQRTAQLMQSEERWQLALKGNNDGIWDWNLQTKEIFISERFQEITGYEHRPNIDYFDEWKTGTHPDDLDLVIQAFQDHLDRKTPHYIIEYRLLCYNSAYKWILSRGQALWDESGKAVRIVGSITDITERKQAEEALRQSDARERERAQQLEQALLELRSTQTQLVQTEKMSSLGQLVAGIAHEVNNPVNFIHANITYLKQYTKQLLDLVTLYQQEYPEPKSKIRDLIEEIDLGFMAGDLIKIVGSMQVGTERIRQIVLSLRNFSRLDEAQMKSVDIHAGIDSTLLILQHRLKASDKWPIIQIVKDFGKLPLVECYASQLNQVFMNIIANGIDAIEERYQKLSVAEAEANPGRISICTMMTTQKTVIVEISDNGTGIPENVRNRIFNPFFTTKEVGKGTGLGMSISHSIVVEKHKGKIECISSIGCGTTFQIEIPIGTTYQ
jgi:PAS domain S-box-containing protein